MDVTPVTLEGTHVRLEPMRVEHYERLAEIGLGQDIFRYFPIAIDTKEQMLGYVQHSVSATDSGAMVVCVTVSRELGEPVGATSYLNIDRRNRKLEIGGTWVAPQWQRTACNTEAKYLQLRHAFETLGCVRVEFKTDSLNAKSRAALLRIGAVEEGTMRNHMIMPDGRLRHSVYFSVTESEWPAVKWRLEGMLGRR
jgi:RimJ/RimL family protein N-acetyltransferase